MTMQPLQTNGGVLTDKTLAALNANLGEIFGLLLGVGNIFYCDYAHGSDTTGDGSVSNPYKTLATAFGCCTSGNNDIVVIIGDGGTTATQRVTAAITWNKSATHLVGICSPSLFGQRARIAPTTTGTAYTPLITVSGSGCIFSNVQFWHGFATGTTSQIAMNITGSRNVFSRCHIAGMADDASAQNANSRCIKFTAGSENVFEDCVIGVDTVTRTAANANIEFASAASRNVFRRCIFPMYATGGTALGIITSAAAALDRVTVFDDCQFLNASTLSGGAAITALATMAAAAGGGILLRYCTLMGITDFFSDATTAAQLRIDGAAPTSNTSGLAVQPT